VVQFFASASEVAVRALEPLGILEKASLESLDPTDSLGLLKLLPATAQIPLVPTACHDGAVVGWGKLPRDCEGLSAPFPMAKWEEAWRLPRIGAMVSVVLLGPADAVIIVVGSV